MRERRTGGGRLRIGSCRQDGGLAGCKERNERGTGRCKKDITLALSCMGGRRTRGRREAEDKELQERWREGGELAGCRERNDGGTGRYKKDITLAVSCMGGRGEKREEGMRMGSSRKNGGKVGGWQDAVRGTGRCKKYIASAVSCLNGGEKSGRMEGCCAWGKAE